MPVVPKFVQKSGYQSLKCAHPDCDMVYPKKLYHAAQHHVYRHHGTKCRIGRELLLSNDAPNNPHPEGYKNVENMKGHPAYNTNRKLSQRPAMEVKAVATRDYYWESRADLFGSGDVFIRRTSEGFEVEDMIPLDKEAVQRAVRILSDVLEVL